MKSHKMPEMKEGGVNVTPLIDVVMCLIIFFMLVAKIGVAGFADPTIDTPASILGKELKDKASTLTLNVRGGQQGSDQPFVTALVEGGTGGLQAPRARHQQAPAAGSSQEAAQGRPRPRRSGKPQLRGHRPRR